MNEWFGWVCVTVIFLAAFGVVLVMGLEGVYH